MADHYSDIGLYYLPIERIMEDEFAPCRNGSPILVLCNGESYIGIWTYIGTDGRFKDGYDIITDTDIEPSHFFPGSLSPIGSHRVIDAVVCADRDGCLLEVHGEHGLAPQDVLDEMPSYYEMIQTVSVRIPYTKTPHGGSS